MAKHVWSVLCRRGVVDQITNQVSLHDVIEQVNVGALPQTPDAVPNGKVALQIEMMVVSYWVRDNADKGERATERVQIVAPGGEIAAFGQIAFDLEKFTQARNLTTVAGLPFSGFGAYWVDVSRLVQGDEWESVARIPFTVVAAPGKPTVN